MNDFVKSWLEIDEFFALRSPNTMRCGKILHLIGILAVASGCKREKPPPENRDSSVPLMATLAAAPTVIASSPEPTRPSPSAAMTEPKRSCPPDMLIIENRYCVDRYEMSLVDVATEQTVSPYYPVLPDYTEYLAARRREALNYETADAGQAANTPMPELPKFQTESKVRPKAVSRAGVVPSAHLSMPVAKAACEASGKRLCALDEWKRACRGETDQKFPYGPDYRPGQCNVFREDHPGHVLFGNFSVGMQDPRMGTISTAKGPLLRNTGQTHSCASRWGNDALYDMVGNLDEWVDDPDGTFVGGFFSRATKEGCDAIVTAHVAGYHDYSIGARCCRDAK